MCALPPNYLPFLSYLIQAASPTYLSSTQRMAPLYQGPWVTRLPRDQLCREAQGSQSSHTLSYSRKPGSGTRGLAPMNSGSQNDGGSKDSRNDHRWANGTEKQELGQLHCRGFCGLFPILSSLSKCDLCC